jgi:predicted MFS family arabinose efflux permease
MGRHRLGPLDGRASVVPLAVLAAVTGLAAALYLPAFAGAVPELVEAGRLRVANALVRAAYNVGVILGAALAGVVVTIVGASWAIALIGASYLLSACLLASLRWPATRPAAGTSPAALREGWREFTSRRWLWGVSVQFAIVVAALNAYAGVLGPVIAARGPGGAGAWSLIMVGQTLGTFVGLTAAVRIQPRRPVLVAALVTGCWALPMTLLAAGAAVPLVMVGAFLSGAAQDVFVVIWTTTLQREVPASVLSRVSSWDILGPLAGAPLGLAAAGPLASAASSRAALLVCAVIVAGATVAASLIPDVRRLPTSITQFAPEP